jgi:hypothetical protein
MKSTADVTMYLTLLHEGTKSTSKGGDGLIVCEHHSTAYEVLPILVAFEDAQAALISTVEPTLAEVASRIACVESACTM